MPHPVKMNRSERNPPFLSNTVKGGAQQVTPNGNTFDKAPSETDGVQGAVNAYWIPPQTWPGGNRSGE